MTSLRVLMWMPRAGDIPGGHRVQLTQTAKALRDLGVDVIESFDVDPRQPDIDVLHGFGLTAEEIHRFRASRIPVALSTIYRNRRYRASWEGKRVGLATRSRHLLRVAQLAAKALPNAESLVAASTSVTNSELQLAATYSAADILLPNAEGEARDLRQDFDIATPMIVVPNGVDPDLFSVPTNEGGWTRDSVLCVGRIEPHKNQLGLIEALRDSRHRLVIAGPDHPHHPDYAARCRQAAGDDVTFLGNVRHEELPALYSSARVHVLPSWFESTGLVSLEAGLCGCAVATTSRGFASEYFGDLASYCDPADSRTIRAAVERGWQFGAKEQLRTHILDNFTWKQTAEFTVKSYLKILGI